MRTPSLSVFSLFAAASFFACHAPGEGTTDDAADGAVSTSRREALTLAANMVWADPADATLTLAPGSAFGSVTDASASSHEVYKVLVDPRPNTENGSVTVSRFWKDATAASCATRSLSVRAQARAGLILNYFDIKVADVTSTFTNTGGEFPEQGCYAAVTFSFASSVANIHLMAQARSAVTFNGIPLSLNAPVSVSASGKSAAPLLQPSMHIDPDGAANAVIVNNGPVTAPGVDADITYSYDYCPPPLSGEPFYCVLDSLATGQCLGPYCGPHSWGNGQRQPLKCSWTKNDFPVETIPANGGVLNWVWHQPGTQDRCGLCVPEDNRCANIYTTVTAKSTVAPYNQMPSVAASAADGGVY